MENRSCCYRKVWDEYPGERCIWHAEVRDIEKDLEKLEQQRETEANRKLNRGLDDNYSELLQQAVLSGADLGHADLSGAMLVESDFSGAMLLEADLSEANLHSADLSEANLTLTDLSEADLEHADLSEAETGIEGPDLSGAELKNANLTDADFQYADLSGATLWKADLSGTDLREADLSGANLREADLSGADLRGSDLRNAVLAGTTLDDVSLARSTSIDDPADRIKKPDFDLSDPGLYDTIARTNHELRAAYSENGLTGRARRARVRERTARRKEAFAEGGWRGSAAGFGSLASRVLAGYGVQLWPVALVMLLLYGVSAVIYWGAGMAPDRALYYSVVTFTTSPPEPPPLGLASIVAGLETFAGTALIVLLGYVLGTREQV